jgi:hypothetical protein
MNSLASKIKTDPDEDIRNMYRNKLRSLEPKVMLLRSKEERLLREEERLLREEERLLREEELEETELKARHRKKRSKRLNTLAASGKNR